MAGDVLTSGIEPGGLTTSYEIRALVCYLFAALNTGLSADDVNNILQENGLVNYFELSSAVADLLRLGNLELSQDSITMYLTPAGRDLAKEFERTIPFSVREKAAKAGIKFLARQKRDRENRVEINRADNGYEIKIRMLLNDKEDLLNLSLNIADRTQADTMKAQFLSDPELFYKGVLSLLIGDMETVGGLFPGKDAELYKD